MEAALKGDDAVQLVEKLLRLYYTTQDYPWTRHHIDSYDQFLSQDLAAVIKSQNPLILLQEKIGDTDNYLYKAEVFIGGKDGNALSIGSPTLSLQNTKEVRLLLPNEARLRNLTYKSQVQADIYVRITFTEPESKEQRIVELDPEAEPFLKKFPLFEIPIMLHSRYCLLNKKPESFLKEAGECVYDYGGYFIIEGSEKILVTSQQQAFNTLYISQKPRDPKVAYQALISCLNPTTRAIRRVGFNLYRRSNAIEVQIPYVRKPVPLFVLFRALGIQADEDIVRAILPNPDSDETKILEPMVDESITHAFPFLDTYSSIEYIKVLTKGFSDEHVMDVLHNNLFAHCEDNLITRAMFLGDCVRKILRVAAGIDEPTDRDDIRNQRCLTSGILIRMLFQGVYENWTKQSLLTFDKEYKYNKSIYKGSNFTNLFSSAILSSMMLPNFITDGLMRGFKGKWGAKTGDEEQGVLQMLSRLSYMDFLSHCRRLSLEFDTSMKLQGPRRLHTSQYGYFCTNETPSGASIGITKNMNVLTAMSTYCLPSKVVKWLFDRAGVIPCDEVTSNVISLGVPVFLNSGLLGYTLRPNDLVRVLKLLKWTGCLPAFTSAGFSIRDKYVFLYIDEGRPLRPLIHLENGRIPTDKLRGAKSWRDLFLGNLPLTESHTLSTNIFVDPLASVEVVSLELYEKTLLPHIGCIEYVDPYEHNESYVACFPEQVLPSTTHLEVHPSTMFGLMTSIIPFANHNQGVRNQLSCSQSKQGLSLFATNFQNRFDNQVHVLCYSEAPLVRTLYFDHVANGNMGYGQNLILAMGCFSGYNQEDGIVMNADALQRGLFNSIAYRSYECFEEVDEQAKTETKIGNPANVPAWTSLKPGLDYTKLDERGIIREGEYVDENTALVGRYMRAEGGAIRDASLTPQVWTTGIVEKVVVMIDNNGRALVKVRVTQYRFPELGDKFSNRHGQKGTIGMMIRGHDMPRTKDGLIPDMIMNTHAIPSRMTIAQLLEALLGKTASLAGAIGDATTFMNTGSPHEAIGKVLRDQLGMEPIGEELLYDGTTGVMIPSTIFMGNVYTMRLKHMVEDKWNARGEGRREQRTHLPTGGRGNQGGLRIGEMERDAILGHGIASFVRESYMKRADGAEFVVCNGCGTIPIYNEKTGLAICSMCDGPVRFYGDNANNLQIIPNTKRSNVSFSKIEMPYSVKLLEQELSSYMNVSMRFLTNADLQTISPPLLKKLTLAEQEAALSKELPRRIILDTNVPEFREAEEEAENEVFPENEEQAEKERPPELPGAIGAVVEGDVEAEEMPVQLEGAPLTQAAPVATTNITSLAPMAPSGNAPYLVVPLPSNTAQAYAGPQAYAGQQAFTGTQPYSLVQPPPPQTETRQIILNTNIAPAAQVLQTGIPGTGPVIQVDTSEQALRAQGLQPSVQTANRPRSNSPKRVEGATPGATYGGNVKVNVIRN
jgi:DNA-directed RNA polymerase II subunit RPB2